MEDRNSRRISLLEDVARMEDRNSRRIGLLEDVARMVKLPPVVLPEGGRKRRDHPVAVINGGQAEIGGWRLWGRPVEGYDEPDPPGGHIWLAFGWEGQRPFAAGSSSGFKRWSWRACRVAYPCYMEGCGIQATGVVILDPEQPADHSAYLITPRVANMVVEHLTGVWNEVGWAKYAGGAGVFAGQQGPLITRWM